MDSCIKSIVRYDCILDNKNFEIEIDPDRIQVWQEGSLENKLCGLRLCTIIMSGYIINQRVEWSRVNVDLKLFNMLNDICNRYVRFAIFQ